MAFVFVLTHPSYGHSPSRYLFTVKQWHNIRWSSSTLGLYFVTNGLRANVR